MKKLLHEDGFAGFLIVALVAVSIATLSAVSLLDMISTDSSLFETQTDIIQEELLLRSESKRSDMMLARNLNILHGRKIQMNNADRLTTYRIDLTKRTENVNLFGSYISSRVEVVGAYATAKRSGYFTSGHQSPVSRYTEKFLHQESLAQYFYFTDTDESENADGNDDAKKVYFYGKDILYGKVHSNSDIWIKQSSGTANPDAPGWPLFLGAVTTTGVIQHANGVPPMDDVFQGGYTEHVAPIQFNGQMTDVRLNGIRPFGDGNGQTENKIVFIHMLGGGVQAYLGTLTEPYIDTFVVYSSYPTHEHPNAPIGDSLFTNYVSVRDTVWVSADIEFPGNTSVFIPYETMIWGEVSGSHTIGCADTTFIVGNILYTGTVKGAAPDDPDNINTSDYFGLLSEKRIYIKYKYYDPETGQRENRTCIPNDGVYLYGAYAALGDGEGDCHQDGIISFEYQHPHGSSSDFWGTSPYTGVDTLYTWVDLHLFKFPGSPFAPWPASPGNSPDDGFNNVDYPWYNPIWPEPVSQIVFERGGLYVFGAFHQRRRGFVHRSGQDPYNHLSPSTWDIPNYHYACTHPSTGYDKHYKYDNRLLYNQPPDYPQIYQGFGGAALSSFQKQNWSFQTPNNHHN